MDPLTRFLTPKEWEQMITTEQFTKCELIEESILQSIQTERSLLLTTVYEPKTLKLSFDDHVWDFSEKGGKRHKPVHKLMKLFGKSEYVIQCISYDNPHFKKEILILDQNKYLHYFLEEGTNYPIERKRKRKRITPAEAKQFQDLLTKRTTKDAKALAVKEGIILTSKQAANQVKNCSEVIVGKTGPKLNISYEDVTALEKILPGDVNLQCSPLDENLEFSVMKFNAPHTKLFLSRCPKREEYNAWQDKVDEITLASFEVKKRAIQDLSSLTGNSIKFANRMFLDTTFNVSHLYLTQLIGEIDSFRTKQSGKNRTLTLAWMLHSNKYSQTHEVFADKILKFFKSCWADVELPSLTSLYIDGEPSLLQYSKVLNVPPLRCDFHLFAQFSRKIGRTTMEAQKKYIFGEIVENKWRRGVLGAFDGDEFDRKLSALKGVLHPYLYGWLTTNREMLLNCSTISAKLKAGHVLQYGTTNAIESTNAKLKAFLTKPKSLEELVTSLNDYCSDEIKEICKAAAGYPDLVVSSLDTSALTMEDRMMYFKNAGLPAPALLSWGLPMRLVFNIDFISAERMFEEGQGLVLLNKTSNFFVYENSNTDLDNPERVSTVMLSTGPLLCSVCNKSSNLCCHRIRALSDLTLEERNKELLKLNPINSTPHSSRSSSTQQIQTPTLSLKAGHKASDRYGSRYSARNHIRRIADISDITLLKATEKEKETSCSDDDELLENEPELGDGVSYVNDRDLEEYGDLSNDRYEMEDVTEENGPSGSSLYNSTNPISPPRSKDYSDSAENLSSSPLANSTMKDGKIRVSKRCRRPKKSFSPTH